MRNSTEKDALDNRNAVKLTLSQTTATAQVAAMTPILPRNRTNVPTLFIAMTRSALLVRIPNACKPNARPLNSRMLFHITGQLTNIKKDINAGLLPRNAA